MTVEEEESISDFDSIIFDSMTFRYDERIMEIAIANGLTERDIRKKFCREPEEVYAMDDSDDLLRGIDIVLFSKFY